jgi:hypothetical protein
MIPILYSDGSRCKACASRARHRSYVEREYGPGTGELYDQLMEWQGGRCYICQEMPQTLRLAVDHDHVSGAVRGLLCAGREQGCNWNYRKALGDVAVAKRVYSYAQMPPARRMREGLPGAETPRALTSRESAARALGLDQT